MRLCLCIALALMLTSCQAVVADDTDAPLQASPPPAVEQTLEALPEPSAVVAPLDQILRPTAAPAATAEGMGNP